MSPVAAVVAVCMPLRLAISSADLLPPPVSPFPFAAATYQVADASGVVYGDGEPHLCPTDMSTDVTPSSLGLTPATATWTYAISKPDYIWGFKVSRGQGRCPGLGSHCLLGLAGS